MAVYTDKGSYLFWAVHLWGLSSVWSGSSASFQSEYISMTVLSSDQRLAWGAIFGNHASQLPFFPVTRSSGYLVPNPNLDLHPILSPSVVRWKLASECLWEHF